MTDTELLSKLDTQLRTLRKADSQKEAVAWMADAYRLMESCIESMKASSAEVNKLRRQLDHPETAIRHSIFLPVTPHIEIVQEIPAVPKTGYPMYSARSSVWCNGETVVYPETPLPFVSESKPWKRIDTQRLVAHATNHSRIHIQRKGR